MFYVRYLTAVDSFLSTSPPVQKYHTLTSGSVEVPLVTRAGNPSSLGKEPVPNGTHFTSMRRSTTIALVSHAEQSLIMFTDILQGHDTVVLVGCISE